MRWVKQLLLLLAVSITATVGIAAGLVSAIWGFLLIEDIRINAFYSAHPMLRAMRDAKGENAAMTKILLDRIPPGTNHSTALQILSAENVICDHRRGRVMVCGPIKRPCSVSRWHIELDLTEADNVTGGRVLALKATCES